MTDLIGTIIRFEQGDASPTEAVDLLAHLVKTGQAWCLQGVYGRLAASLIDRGYITPEGDVTELGRLMTETDDGY